MLLPKRKNKLNFFLQRCQNLNKLAYNSFMPRTSWGLLRKQVMKKITLSTIKSFIKKTPDLHIDVHSVFDGMSDCVMPVSDSGFTPAHKIDLHLDNTLGIQGAWFVKGSRDYFNEYDDGEFKGYTVFNCCGKFILAKPL